MTPEEYRDLIFSHLSPVRLGTETVSLPDAHGRTLATDVVAKFAVPPFNNSSMDGFAVRTDDFAGDGPWTFDVSSDIAAGTAPDDDGASRTGRDTSRTERDGSTDDDTESPVAPAEARPARRPVARIMTGAPVPNWADAVVKVEDTDAPSGASAAPDAVTISVAPQRGQNVRHAGEDIKAGEPAIAAGKQLNARTLSSLASLGYGEVEVSKRPRVAVLATGEELVAPGEELQPGQIPDSNSTLLAGLVNEAGGEAIIARTVADTAEAFGEAIAAVAREVDLIVTSGGVSMGAFDPVKEHGLEHGWTFEKVSMQPGKPQGHGTVDDDGRSVGVICLPGNPVSVAVSFMLFVRPVIEAMLGAHREWRVTTARAGASWTSPGGRRQHIAAKIVSTGNGVEVVPVHTLGSGSHLVAALHAADAFAVVGEDVTEVHPGDVVGVLEL